MWSLFTIAAAGPCLDGLEVPRHEVTFDLVGSVITQKWVAQYESAICPDGAELPPWLDDAQLGLVLEVDGRKQQDIVRVLPLESNSGALTPWRAPAGGVTARFLFGRGVPLQVYTDDQAHLHRNENAVTVWWDSHIEDAPTMLWTTWNDWVSAGKAMATPIESSVPKPADIGSLGRSLRGATLESLVSRLDATVDLPVEAGEPTGWDRGRPSNVVVASGRGSPSERGLLLLSMLRGAGFKARPAWFSATDDPTVPRTFPAPHLLPHPAIVVRQGKETLYLDPGVRGARPPGVPARMTSGRVLPAGKHLVIPNDTGAPGGEVRIQAELQVDAKGKVVFEGTITPTGAAEQAMRAAFTGLEAQQWPNVVTSWITPRGEIRDLVAGVKGLDGMAPFSVDVRFTDPQRLTEANGALIGQILDPIAPGLALALPPGVAIAERLQVVPPEEMFALTAVRPSVQRVEELVLNRSISTDERTLTLAADWHVLTGTGSQAKAAIDKQIGSTEVLLFPTSAGPAKRAVKKLEMEENDKRIVTALLLYHLELPKPAGKQLKKLHKEVAVEPIAELLATYGSVGDRAPWETLTTLVETDAERIAVINGLEASGDRRLGWQLATALTQSEDPLTQTRAFVEVARLQGPSAPDAQADPEGARAWRDPVKLLEYAHNKAREHRDETRLPLTVAYLRGNRPMDAEELLDDRPDTPEGWAAEAEFGALTGVFGIDVLGLIDRALRAAPYDPAVRRSVGRAQAAIGRRREGVRNVLLAAELSGNDHTEWLTAADYAAEMGDLGAALFAVHRASDLVPNYVEPALDLQFYARLAGDEEALQVGVDRLRQEMHVNLTGDLANLITQEPSKELALLRHHTDEVEGDRTLLRRRAALHFERAMFEDAALDGSLLIDEHRDSTGAPYRLAGVTSRFWHADPLKVLGTRSTLTKEARMDMAIVMGERVSATGSRAKDWNLLRRSPTKLAEKAATWPLGMKDFEAIAPDGFKDNRDLSRVRGVMGWSSAKLQRTILRTERSTGEVPPPISILYKNGPTVLTTDRGASVLRLDGGGLPIFAGVTAVDGQDVIGLGLSPSSARDAVLHGIGALTPPQ